MRLHVERLTLRAYSAQTGLDLTGLAWARVTMRHATEATLRLRSSDTEIGRSAAAIGHHSNHLGWPHLEPTVVTPKAKTPKAKSCGQA